MRIHSSRSCMGRNTEGEIYWRDVGTLDSFWQTNIDLDFRASTIRYL